MRISYAIPVCNEDKELDRLLAQLLLYETPDMEVVVQCDQGNTSPEVYRVLDKYSAFIHVIEFPLKGDFATFKNNLKKHCTGAWIFQIDADEYLSEGLIKNLPAILRSNPTVDLLLVPRINTVEGLTQEHINKWGWRVDENGWVNYPDPQTRIIKNKPEIKWENKVHERIVGYSTAAALPYGYDLLHPKTITRQEKQNDFYDKI